MKFYYVVVLKLSATPYHNAYLDRYGMWHRTLDDDCRFSKKYDAISVCKERWSIAWHEGRIDIITEPELIARML
jgi:hypothetical protein